MTTNTYLRYSIISLIFVIPFVSLVVFTSLFFPYITGKNLAFRAIIEIAGALYLILALRAPEYRPKINSIFLAFSAFLVVLFFADLFGEYPFKSFLSNFERMEGFFTIVHLFVYFVIMTSVLNTEKLWKRFFQTSLAASVIMGLVGVNELSQPTTDRISATLGNSTYLGIYMLFNMFIAGFLLIRHIERPKSNKGSEWFIAFMYVAIIAFDFYIFYSTGTRGALLGLIAGALFTSVAFAIFEKNKGLKYAGVGILAAILIAAGSLAIAKNTPFVQNHTLLARFSQLATFDPKGLEEFATTQGKARFSIWSIAYEGFKERPILGWGQDNFNYVFNKYYDPRIYDQEQWFDRAHDVFFDWLIAGGMLGLLAYLSLFAAAIVAIWRSRNTHGEIYLIFSDKVVLTALLIAYFIHNLFVFDSITSYILFFGVLAFVNLHEKSSIQWNALYRRIDNRNYITAGAVIAVIAGGASLYYFTIAPYVSSSELITALSYQNYGLQQASGVNTDPYYETAIENYQSALAYQTEGKEEIREQIVEGAGSVIASAASNNVKGAYYNLARQQMEEQLKETPNDARYWLFYGSFLTHVGASSTDPLVVEGISDLEKAHELSPNKQTILFELGAAYLNAGQYPNAMSTFKEAYELDTDYQDAKLYYVLSLFYVGDTKDAATLLATLDSSLQTDPRVTQAEAFAKSLNR
jgi:O-antigen ligase